MARERHWVALASEVLPYVDALGTTENHVLYLMHNVDARNGADIDEYRALAAYAQQARAIRGAPVIVPWTGY